MTFALNPQGKPDSTYSNILYKNQATTDMKLAFYEVLDILKTENT